MIGCFAFVAPWRETRLKTDRGYPLTSRSASRVQRIIGRSLRTAMANAYREPTMISSFMARVIAVYTRLRWSITKC